VSSELKPFHELGQRYPTELRPGNVNISGSIERAAVNGALLKLLLGDAASSRPKGTFVSPAFNLDLRLENPSRPGVASRSRCTASRSRTGRTRSPRMTS
jgi:hypothetical protein